MPDPRQLCWRYKPIPLRGRDRRENANQRHFMKKKEVLD